MSASDCLFIYRAEPITLADILSALTDMSYTALLEGVEQYLVGRHTPGSAEAGAASALEVASQVFQTDADSGHRIRARDTASLEGVIRARLFNGDFDLVWDRHGDSTLDGAAWLRGEECVRGVMGAGTSDRSECSRHTVFHTDNPYLIWGKVAAFEDGWATLHDQRVGNITVPISEAPVGSSIRMRAREYFGPAPGEAGEKHGNWRLLAECFCGFEVYESPKTKGETKDAQAGEGVAQ